MSFHPLLLAGSVTGNISYNRYVNSVGTNEWDLIGAPVEGQSINSFVTANASTLASNGDAYAIGYYDNYWNEWKTTLHLQIGIHLMETLFLVWAFKWLQ